MRTRTEGLTGTQFKREFRPWFRRRFGIGLYVLLKNKPETKVDEAHGWEPHYELHLWVFRDNPNGMYSEFNPQVTCRHHKPPPQMAMH